jgi:diaminohydroxyphosphoribosylaminopyrimidine deaminase / 5-amino-6-(5-phosphoribosylamino)uracil reductase
MITGEDRRFMEAAIRLARHHEGWTATNPSVACVIVADEGGGPVIVGSGITAIGGRPHAEPIAIGQAGERARGATAYLTLEPCAHHGRTPPCAQNLIDAGVRRVVTAVVDPDTRVNERGHAMLREAGIAVETGICAAESALDLAGYLKHKSRRVPFVTLKLAVSADGLLGMHGRGQVPITGAVSRAQSHMMRARSHAILVGAGTVLADDPMLTCRLPGLESFSPSRVILDARGRLTGREKVIETAPQTPTIVVGSPGRVPDPVLAVPGCSVLACEIDGDLIALPELLDDLGARGFMSVLVEGGAKVAENFLAEDLVDELVLFRGTAEIGDGSGAEVRSPVTADSVPAGFQRIETLALGEDQFFRYRKAP